MSLIVIGLNHQTAPVTIRERVTFGPDILSAGLHSVTEEQASEAVILSTCNRTELYCYGEELDPDRLLNWLARFHGLDAAEISPYLYLYQESHTVSHLLKVASGLNSMVLGEPQILGQVKSAWQAAKQANTVGKILDRLFQHSFSTAKQVRTDTAIGDSPVSVAFAAVSLSKRIFSDLSQQTALLIGAGETIELAARHLKQQNIARIIIANRTVAKAHELAEQFNAYAIGLTEIPVHLAEADIVIASTASPVPILGKGAVESALKKRRYKPMFMVDIAVPRDIESEVKQLEDVYLYTVDDLKEVIQYNIKSRQQAAEQAEEIIQLKTHEFIAWLRSLDAVSMIRSYRQQADQIKQDTLRKAQKKLQNGESPEKVLQFLANTLTNKLLHTPSSQLREAGSNGQTELLAAASTLFQLDRSK